MSVFSLYTGSIRFDIFKGPFTRNDQVRVPLENGSCPPRLPVMSDTLDQFERRMENALKGRMIHWVSRQEKEPCTPPGPKIDARP
jgi:hypothetical protein